MKQILILFMFFLFTGALKSQTPVNDPNYELDAMDDFTTLNPSLWWNLPYNSYTWGWGLETYIRENVTVSDNVLTLKCEKKGDNYISGGRETFSFNNRSFSYGYFEIESKLPTTGTRGPWGGFWMQTGEGGWDEIDVFEPNGCDCEVGTSYTLGSHATHNGIHYTSGTIPITGLPDLSYNYYKYSVIWTPQQIQFFFNGTMVKELFAPEIIPTHPMFIFLTFQIDKFGCQPNSTEFPTKYWKYKNFAYYKLKTDCSNGITQSNFVFTGHDYKVQKFYSLSNSTVPINSNVILHATDYIRLNTGFIVPLGSTFKAITHFNTCPD